MRIHSATVLLSLIAAPAAAQHGAEAALKSGRIVKAMSTETVRPNGRFDQLVHFGHGAVFDAQYRQVAIDPESALAAQRDLLKRLEGSASRLAPKPREIVRTGQKLVLTARPAEAVAVNQIVIDQLVATQPLRMRADLSARNRALAAQIGPAQLSPAIAAFLKNGIIVAFPTTAYMKACTAAGVPVPPNFSTTSTAWKFQGKLTTKIIQANQDANVWTWASASRKGACIALPRGTGTPGSLAGIICQSATTGKACFWDNKLRGSNASLGWKNITLKIADLQDGNVLAENCTGCHRGNNVFLMSPDDPVWGKVMGRNGPLHPKFTTTVSASTDMLDGHPRYIPMSSQATWKNVAPASDPFCNACHEKPVVAQAMVMPPACSSLPTGCNVEP
ncbi:hypothetical protein [Glacieibacterium frigidum]|uniref:Cytochrome P460 domain-containing protein n=1 Tax=Glacieibacterium frigidum TaxID=2593303 RepID=A0A552UIX8_9SPHN|nr:hypothetical protein [Glacieibacterium frigidum]TRW18176.1 hypothetical protein FMM06_08750 [Glacieibacterium frigidum]